MKPATPDDESDAPTTLVRSGSALAEDLRKVALEHAHTEPHASATTDAQAEALASAATQAPAAPRHAAARLSAEHGPEAIHSDAGKHAHTAEAHDAVAHDAVAHDAVAHDAVAHDAEAPQVVLRPSRPANPVVVVAFLLIALGLPMLGALGLLGRPSSSDVHGSALSPNGTASPIPPPAAPPQ